MATTILHSVSAAVGPVTSTTFATTGIVTVTDDYTVVSGKSVVRCDSCAPVMITLPAAASNTGRFLTIINVNCGGAVIDPNASELVCGLPAIVLLEANESITLICDGTGWDSENCDKDRLEKWLNFCTIFRFHIGLTTKLSLTVGLCSPRAIYTASTWSCRSSNMS